MESDVDENKYFTMLPRAGSFWADVFDIFASRSSSLIGVLFLLSLLLPFLALVVRRFHDVGISGWCSLCL